MSWESLGCAISVSATPYLRWEVENKVELLWTGPSPASEMRARRIGQVLYDMIATAQEAATCLPNCGSISNT